MVPGKTLADTAKALGGTGAEVEIALSAAGGTGEGMIGFSSAGRRTTTRLLDPEFPKYRSLLPTEFSAPRRGGDSVVRRGRQARGAGRRAQHAGAAGVPRAARSCWRPAAATRRRRSRCCRCDFEGEEINIAFNHQFLLEGLGAIDSDVARLQMTTSTKPAILTGGKPVDDGGRRDYRYLIMPIRLSELTPRVAG